SPRSCLLEECVQVGLAPVNEQRRAAAAGCQLGAAGFGGSEGLQGGSDSQSHCCLLAGACIGEIGVAFRDQPSPG
ncbi:MAG: hypothetical protein ACJ8FZ_00220, partial [Bradyrhizobium sp.]